jgi:hypothetical protein
MLYSNLGEMSTGFLRKGGKRYSAALIKSGAAHPLQFSADAKLTRPQDWHFGFSMQVPLLLRIKGCAM